MRFKELTVHDEGPIKNLRVRFDNVNLIVGDNEEGKTTLTDILVRRLLGDSGKMSRGGKQLLKAGRFKPSTAENLVTEGEEFDDDRREFARLLVVREGENRIAGKDGAGLDDAAFWNSDVKDMIYGRDGIYAKLSCDFKQTLGASTRASWLNQFREKLGEVRSALDVQLLNVERLKSNRAQCAVYVSELETNKAKLSVLESSRAQSEDSTKLRLANRFFKLKDDRREIAARLEDLRRADWQRIQSEWDELRRRTADLKVRYKETKLELANSLKQSDIARERLDELDSKLLTARDELEEYRRARETVTLRKSSKASVAPWIVLTALCLGIAVLGILGLTKVLFPANPLPPWASIAALTAGGFGFLAGFVGLVVKIVASPTVYNESARSLNDLMERGSETGSVTSLDRRIDKSEKELEILLSKREEFLAAIGELDSEIGNYRLEVERAEDAAREISARESEFTARFTTYESVIESGADLRSGETRLASLDRELEDVSAEAEKAFGTTSDTRLHEEIVRLQKRIKDSGETGTDFDEEDYQNLRAGIDSLQDGLANLREESNRLRGIVETGVDAELDRLGRLGDNVRKFYPQTASLGLMGDAFNIYGLSSEFDKLLAKVDEDLRLSGILSEAFDRANSRVDEIVGSVLGEADFGRALRKLTGNTYVSANYEINDKSVEIKLAKLDKTEYHLKDLSTGARNQFSLAARFAIASKEFKNKEAVFVLDDAFLTFDAGRRKSSVEFLKDLAGEGWQIVYSSVNDGAMEPVFDEVFGKDCNKIRLGSE